MKRPWSVSLIAKFITEDPNVVYPEEDVWGSIEDDIKKAAKEGKRDPQLEEEILAIGDPYYAYHYAYKVIKGRWSEGEEAIKKSPTLAYRYVKYIIKGRWPEGEEAIKKDPVSTMFYRHFIEQSA